MKIIKNVKQKDWETLTNRPELDKQDLYQIVNDILDNVKENGDKALKSYTKQFDKVYIDKLLISQSEIDNANKLVPLELKQAINIAKQNIEKFHKAQIVNEEVVETSIGVECWRKAVGIEKVGLYIPGGSAPLFSTVLMLGIPAKIAGCKDIYLSTPPNIAPEILYVADLV